MAKDASQFMGVATDPTPDRLENQALTLRNMVPVSPTNIAPRGGVSLVNHYQQESLGRQIYADGLPNALGNGILIVATQQQSGMAAGRVDGVYAFFPRAIAPIYLTNTGLECAAYDFPVPWSDGADSNNFLAVFPFPATQPEFFTPRPPRFGTGGTGANWTDILGRSWLIENWFSDAAAIGGGNPNVDKVAVGWSATAPEAYPTYSRQNAEWPVVAWHLYHYGVDGATAGYWTWDFDVADMPAVNTDNDHLGSFAKKLNSATIGSGARYLLTGYTRDGKFLMSVYFDAPTDRVIPANTFRLRLMSSGTLAPIPVRDRFILIDSPILGGVWNTLELTMPASNNEIGPIFTDLDNVDQDGVEYFSCFAFLNASIAAGVFDDDGHILLYFTSCRQIMEC